MMKGRRKEISLQFLLPYLGEKLLRELCMLLQSKAEFRKESGNIVVTKILSLTHFSDACPQGSGKLGQ